MRLSWGAHTILFSWLFCFNPLCKVGCCMAPCILNNVFPTPLVIGICHLHCISFCHFVFKRLEGPSVPKGIVHASVPLLFFKCSFMTSGSFTAIAAWHDLRAAFHSFFVLLLSSFQAFKKIHGLYADTTSNPFYEFGLPLQSPRFTQVLSALVSAYNVSL